MGIPHPKRVRDVRRCADHKTLIHAQLGTGVNPSGGYLEVCQLLVQSGAILETPDTTYGRTATHWAVYYHLADILVELIISGGGLRGGRSYWTVASRIRLI